MVNIPLYQQQLIGVQRDTVRLYPAVKTIRTVGHVGYDETKLATVNLRMVFPNPELRLKPGGNHETDPGIHQAS
ncbi:MAG: hypothetical protein ACE5HZ_07535 [Fidelibacterota bacterium]